MTTFPDYAAAAPRTPWALRALAVVGGLLLLAIAVPPTIGTVLAAPVGMLVLALVARRRGRTLGRGASWLAATGAVAIAIVVGMGAVYSALPDGTFARIQQAADSVEAVRAKEPPPAWLERIAPGAAQAGANAPGMSVVQSRAFTVWAGVTGAAIAVAFFGAVAGSVGWAGTSLLVYGVRGTWIPRGGAPAER